MENMNNYEQPALRDVYKDDFYVGVALNDNQIRGEEPEVTALVQRHFNSLSPENVLKWAEVHPEPNRYDFEAADRFVAYGEKLKMHIIGHTLVWFHQTPNWVFQDESGKPVKHEVLLQRMKDHIFTVVGRYKGRIHGWDVVNEAIVPDGRFRPNKWLEIIGEDYVLRAYEYARQADPDAQLYYNDYNMWMPDQWKGVIRLVENLQSNGIRIDGLGIQGHWGLDYPDLEEIETFIIALANLNVKLMITELDVTVLPFAEQYMDKKLSSLDPELQKELNPYASALPVSVQLEQARRYTEFFSIFRKHSDKISRVSFWGVHDGQSWRSDWPVIGRTDYPLLFDRNCQPKSAFDAVVKTGQRRV